MDKFSQLIIEAYRNPNFRFAEETAPVDPESEIVAPSALDYPSLFSRMQSLEDDMKTKILEYLTRAQTKLKMDYNIDSELPIKFVSSIFSDTYSDNSNANTDEKIQTYFYRVFEYLVDYFENEASSAPTSESTSSSESEESNPLAVTDPSTDSSSGETSADSRSVESVSDDNSPEGRKANSILSLSIDVDGAKQTFNIDEPRIVGSNPSNLGFKIVSNQLTADHMLFYPLARGWGVLLNSPIKINGHDFGAGGRYKIYENDVIKIGNIYIKIDSIKKNDGSEPLSSEPLSAESITYEPLSSTTSDSTPTGSPSKALEGASESSPPDENIPPITIKVSGGEYSPPEYITLVERVNFIGSNPNCAIVLNDDSVTKYNCVIQFQNEKWRLSKQANSSLAINGKFVDEFSDLNEGDFFVPGTKAIYILSVVKIGTESGGFFGDSAPSRGGFFGGSGGRGGGFGGGFGGRRR